MTAMTMSATTSNSLAFHAFEEPEAEWYLQDQQAFQAQSWAEQAAATFTTAAAPLNPNWSAPSHMHANSFDSNDNQAGFANTYLNSYLSPPSTVVDFVQSPASGASQPHTSAHHAHAHAHAHSLNGLQLDSVRFVSHSPSMLTTVSFDTSGSESPFATPPPPPPAASMLRSAAAAQNSAANSRPSNRRRSTAPAGAGIKKEQASSSTTTSATAEKNRERRSGHSAVERKYRENLNGKIEVLRQVLVDAHRSYDIKSETARYRSARNSNPHSSQAQHPAFMDYAPMSASLARGRDCGNASAPRKDGYPPAESVITFAATIGSKKSDVLSSAIHYIKEAEQSRSMLVQQVAFLQGQIVKLESIMAGGGNDNRDMA